MHSLLAVSSISALIILLSWVFTYEVLGMVWNILPKIAVRPRLKVMLIGVPIFLLHIAAIWVYAAAYFMIENYTDFGGIVGGGHHADRSVGDFFDCLYFSSAIYTSLGLGDLVPTKHLRMLVAAEVLNGLVLIGWSISFTYLTMERFWQSPAHRPRHDKKD